MTMTAVDPCKIHISRPVEEHDLLKGSFVSILHVTRIPPHIGMIHDKTYHSLSLKGHELNVPVAALLKNNRIRRIPSLFFQLAPHAIFSQDYLREHFITNIQQYKSVAKETATCISPVRNFFEEIYHFPVKDLHYIYQLVPALIREGLIIDCFSQNIDSAVVQLPTYSAEQIDQCIDDAVLLSQN